MKSIQWVTLALLAVYLVAVLWKVFRLPECSHQPWPMFKDTAFDCAAPPLYDSPPRD